MKILFYLFVVILCINISSCSIREQFQPPAYIFMAWSKSGVSTKDVIADMKLCGYGDNVATANELNDKKIEMAELCMKNNGYAFDDSSYRPNNCYGNAPYPCRKYWGGKKSSLVPIKSYKDAGKASVMEDK